MVMAASAAQVSVRGEVLDRVERVEESDEEDTVKDDQQGPPAIQPRFL